MPQLRFVYSSPASSGSEHMQMINHPPKTSSCCKMPHKNKTTRDLGEKTAIGQGYYCYYGQFRKQCLRQLLNGGLHGSFRSNLLG